MRAGRPLRSTTGLSTIQEMDRSGPAQRRNSESGTHQELRRPVASITALSDAFKRLSSWAAAIGSGGAVGTHRNGVLSLAQCV